jgi:hypothetical protein
LGNPERWLLYRTLVRDRLQAMIRAGLPRTIADLGEDVFRSWFGRFLDEAPPRDRYIRQVVPELVAFLVPRLRGSNDARPWTPDLALYECAMWEVRFAEDRTPETVGFDFERLPVLNPALRVVDLEHPVHRKADTYPSEATHLCIYRPKGSFKPDTWTLTPLAAQLMHRWREGRGTVAETVRAVAEERGVGIDPEFIEKLSTMLASFLERGILLGGRPPTS